MVSDGRVRPLADVAADQARALRDQMGSGSEDRDLRHVFVEPWEPEGG